MYPLAIVKHPLVIYQQLIVKLSIYLSWSVGGWVAVGFVVIIMKISVKVGLKLANWN